MKADKNNNCRQNCPAEAIMVWKSLPADARTSVQQYIPHVEGMQDFYKNHHPLLQVRSKDEQQKIKDLHLALNEVRVDDLVSMTKTAIAHAHDAKHTTSLSEISVIDADGKVDENAQQKLYNFEVQNAVPTIEYIQNVYNTCDPKVENSFVQLHASVGSFAIAQYLRIRAYATNENDLKRNIALWERRHVLIDREKLDSGKFLKSQYIGRGAIRSYDLTNHHGTFHFRSEVWLKLGAKKL